MPECHAPRIGSYDDRYLRRTCDARTVASIRHGETSEHAHQQGLETRELRIQILRVSERHIIQPNRIGLLLVVAILLVVNRDAVPTAGSWILVVIQRGSLTVQRDRLEQQLIARCSLRLND